MKSTTIADPLARVFQNTVAPYKFLWLLSLLELVVREGRTVMHVDELTARMVAKAWYPKMFFRLSYGRCEAITRCIEALGSHHGWTHDTSEKRIVDTLLGDSRSSVHQVTFKLLRDEVPYRFLTPWIRESDNARMQRRSETFENNCFYALRKGCEGLFVHMHLQWADYLREHYVLVRDFTYWHWSRFLQARNPNVPNIVNKLERSSQRSSLEPQRTYWRRAIRRMERLPNVYRPAAYFDCDTPFALDHFLPWRFVAHDRLWNLMPIDASLNSAKSDRLPDVEALLPRFALTHRDALRISLHHGDDTACQHDYEDLGYALSDIAAMGDEAVIETFRKTYVPLTLIARNMGFETWDYTCTEPS
ncbi:MAG: hypothetical protein J6S08_03445 [Duodenibacillus sp.]|nr:hypothetical protein [Duodenibacillus sp.]